MLAIFNKGLVTPPEELYSTASLGSSRKPKLPVEILNDFLSSNPTNVFSIGFEAGASLAYVPPQNPCTTYQRYNSFILSSYSTLHQKQTLFLFNVSDLKFLGFDEIAGCFVEWMKYTAFSWGVWTICAASSGSMVCQKAPMKQCLSLRHTGPSGTVAHTRHIRSSRILKAAMDLWFMMARLEVYLLHW